ncbi:DegV family protein [Chloroflexota bacterium]
MVRVVTDSAADIPSEVARELGITVVPMYVRFGAEAYRDGVDLDADEFYGRLAGDRRLPVSSAPSPGEVAEVYNRLAEETDEVLSVHVSSKLTSMFEVALQATWLLKKRCRVELIDSKSGAMGEGLIAIAAAKVAQQGADLEQVGNVARKAVSKSHVRMCFDTLEYLRRGGRVGRVKALMGSVLKINPIIGLKDGEAHPYGRERSRSRAVDRLCQFVDGLSGISELAVEHASTPDEAEAMAERLGSRFPRERMYLSRVSPVVGVHVGPHVLAVCVLES